MTAVSTLLALPQTARAADAAPTHIQIEADRLDHDPLQQRVTASGQVRVTRGEEMTLEADEVSFQPVTRTLDAQGQVRMRYGADQFQARQLQIDPRQRRGRMEGGLVDMAGPGGRGTAETVILHDPNTLTLEQATFTNCDCTPAPWVIESDRILVDRARNQATARNVTLRLHGAPIAYTPWWRHPVGRVRQSGLLTPSFSLSGSNGFEADIPFYWNIAPDRDATFTAHPTTRRGTMGKMQYRYLGAGYGGDLETHGIYDTKEERYRGLSLVNHRHQLDDWRVRLRLEHSQTRDFINDFEQKLVDDSTRYLESHLVTDRLWSGDGFFTGLEAGSNWFQDLTTTTSRNTVQQLPFARLTDSRVLGPADSDWLLDSTLRYDNFFQTSGDVTHRLDMAPVIGYMRPLHIGRFNAQLGLRETAYEVSGTPTQAGGHPDATRHREAGLVNLRLDGHLERIILRPPRQGDRYRAFKHTIEPAVQYTLNAVNGQGDVPNYDSSLTATSTDPVLRSFTATNLFATNLYPGLDRISGGHWLSYGVTNRLLGRRSKGDEVRELASFTIGQRFAPAGHQDYQRDHALSDLVSSLTFFASDRWTLKTDSRYDPHWGTFRAADVILGLENPRRDFALKDKLELGFNLDRQEGEDSIQDALLASDLGLTPTWRWTQRLNYSLEQNGMKSWRTGLAYIHDCWSVEFLAGRRLSADTAEHGGGFAGFLITFQGLGGYGVN
ncbi:MAG: LPS-assembly protein LptD [Magnetococcales bacterium]|nr:LPS-assembly protein LptD [Magnetococcales bacterium]